jgi:hypothetical protein
MTCRHLLAWSTLLMKFTTSARVSTPLLSYNHETRLCTWKTRGSQSDVHFEASVPRSSARVHTFLLVLLPTLCSCRLQIPCRSNLRPATEDIRGNDL